MKIIYLVNLVI